MLNIKKTMVKKENKIVGIEVDANGPNGPQKVKIHIGEPKADLESPIFFQKIALESKGIQIDPVMENSINSLLKLSRENSVPFVDLILLAFESAKDETRMKRDNKLENSQKGRSA